MNKKKIIFDSVALGLSVLFLCLLAMPVVENLSFYSIISIADILTEIGSAGTDPVQLVLLVDVLFMVLLLIFLILITIFLTLALLCDLNVIKSEKLLRAMKITSLTLSSINIFFSVVIFGASFMLWMEEVNFVSMAFILIWSIASVVLIAKAKGKKNAPQVETQKVESQPAVEEKVEEPSETTQQTEDTKVE